MDWTARAIVGGYYPQEDGQLVFCEGYFLQAIRKNQIFWIDEMNRADLDRVLGPIFTFLAGESVDLGPTHLGGSKAADQPKPMVLMWADGAASGVMEDNDQRAYYVGSDWRMVATYNSIDRGRVFPMGSALLRRWALVPVPPIKAAAFKQLLTEQLELPEIVAAPIVALYSLHLEFLPMGPASFLDLARYVHAEELSEYPSELGHQLLSDAYVIYLGQQLVRLDPSRRRDFFEALREICGADVTREIDSI